MEANAFGLDGNLSALITTPPYSSSKASSTFISPVSRLKPDPFVPLIL